MKICGLQKTTLLDYPGHVAATVFLGGCNFRCPFCHNSDLLTPENISSESLMNESEILAFLKKRAGILEGICITGGEPTLQAELEPFIRAVKDMGYAVKLDTNGYRPDVLQDLCEKGLLDYVAMDIKNSPEHYEITAWIPVFQLSHIEKSAAFLMEQTAIPFEFRTTVVKELHSEKDFHAIGQWLKGAPAYFLQAYQDSERVLTPGLSGYDKMALLSFVEILKPYIPNARLRGVD